MTVGKFLSKVVVILQIQFQLLLSILHHATARILQAILANQNQALNSELSYEEDTYIVLIKIYFKSDKSKPIKVASIQVSIWTNEENGF